MKKGFTMVELLAVFTLLGIILVISLPKITSMLKKNSNSEKESFQKTVCLAAEAYVVDNDSFSDGNDIILNSSDLIKEGYLKSSLENPDAIKKAVSNDSFTISLNKTDGTITCNLN